MGAGHPQHLIDATYRRALDRMVRAATRAGIPAQRPRGSRSARFDLDTGTVHLGFTTSRASNGETAGWATWDVALPEYADAGRKFHRYAAPPWMDTATADLARMVWQRGGPEPERLRAALAELIEHARRRAAAMPDPTNGAP